MNEPNKRNPPVYKCRYCKKKFDNRIDCNLHQIICIKNKNK